MQAIILAAGRGTRLGSMTQDMPKCLLEVGDGRTVIEHQLQVLEATRTVEEVVVVVGHGADRVITRIGDTARGVRVSTVFNPDFRDSDSLVSLRLALATRPTEFIVMNGDLILSAVGLTSLLSAPAHHDIALLASRRAALSRDAVKLKSRSGRVLDLGKHIPAGAATAEFAGAVRFTGVGAEIAICTVDLMVSEQGSRQLWSSLIRRLAQDGSAVHVEHCPDREWFEIDYPEDLDVVRRQMQREVVRRRFAIDGNGKDWPQQLAMMQ